jgi:hypothetical protein
MTKKFTKHEHMAARLYPDHADLELRKQQGLEAMAARKQQPRSDLLSHATRSFVSPLGGQSVAAVRKK